MVATTAKWWEVKNESSFQSEWAYHWRKKEGIDGWGLLSDFHHRVAHAIHSRDPSVQVGGPAAAYMQLHQKDFSLFRDHARFIKETRGTLDFFSYHFYENAHMLGAYERRGQGYTNYLLGRYERRSICFGQKCTRLTTYCLSSSQSADLCKTDAAHRTIGYESLHGMLFLPRPCSALIKSSCLYRSSLSICRGIR